MTAADKNAHYGMLNDRFEGRSLRLRNMGFVYTSIPDYDTAVFVRRRLGQKRPDSVSASFVLCADEIVWQDRLDSYS